MSASMTSYCWKQGTISAPVVVVIRHIFPGHVSAFYGSTLLTSYILNSLQRICCWLILMVMHPLSATISIAPPPATLPRL